MEFILDGLRQAWELLLHPTSELITIVRITLEVAFVSTAVALVLGLPVGLLLGLGRFRGRRAMLGVANAGLGLPPVVIGLFLALMMFRGSVLGPLYLIYTLRGVIVAQTVLALPIVIALTAAAVQSLDPGLLAQARALGASRWAVGIFALREAKVGVFAAGIAALGSAFSEVGAVVIVGGNITGQTQTIASAVLVSISAGKYSEGIALGTLLLGIILLFGASLTLAQQRERVPRAERQAQLVTAGRR